MTNSVDTLRVHAVDLGFGVEGVGPAPRRRHSVSNVRADFLMCCEVVDAKAKHHGPTGDDAGLPMPQSWKRTAFVKDPLATRPHVPKLDLSDAMPLRNAFLLDAESRVDNQRWVRNDETPWGVMGGRPEGKVDPEDPHYFASVRDYKIFHNEFRAWLDHSGAENFDSVWKYASMNCVDFVALCLARTALVPPSALAAYYNRQTLHEPRPGSRFSYRYNHLGSPFRRKLDKKAECGDLVFWESKKSGVHHVAILQDTEPKRRIIENADTHAPEFHGATVEELARCKEDTVTYVPFEIAMRTFLAHMNEPGGLYKALSYDAFLRLIPRV